jgi:hypothetical protein
MLVKKIKHNSDADGDEAIGDIESRPVVVAPVDVEKINHLAVEHAIDEITDGAAKNERKPVMSPVSVAATVSSCSQ